MSTSNHVTDLQAHGNSRIHIGNHTTVQAPERSETPPKPSSFIPFCRDSLFIERKTILDQIPRICSTPPSRAALVGLGGVGKSQLAIEYAYRVRDEFTRKHEEIWVFWIHAATRARVEQGFKAIADAVQIRGRNQSGADILQLVYQWLCNEHNGRWLIVLDSADDANVFFGVSQNGEQPATSGKETRVLSTYLPQSSNGSIVVTTIKRDVAFKLTGHHDNIIDVGPMDRSDALALLKKKSGSQFDEVSGIELVDALGNMPLAIGQAAAYIQQRAPRTSVKTYLEEFRQNEQKRSDLLNHDSGDFRREPDVPNSVIAAWQISFEHIRSQRRSAAALLSLMSLFDCQGIQDYLVRPNIHNEYGIHKGPPDNENLVAGEHSSSMFEEDIITLRNYCLISMNETGDMFEMHGLVQLSTRKWLDMHEATETFRMACINRLNLAFPTGEFSNWPICRALFPHVEEAVQYCPDDKELESLKDFSRMLLHGSWYSKEQGRYTTAELMAEKALRASKKAYGAEHESIVWRMGELAEVYSFQRRWKDAEQLLIKAQKIRGAVLKLDDPCALIIASRLAKTYSEEGRWGECESLFQHVIEGWERALGSDHHNTLTGIHNLAYAYNRQERWQEAEPLLQQVVERRKRVLGPNHPDILNSIHNLAYTYNCQKRWQEAELLLQQIVERRKEVLGPDHPNTLASIHNLASAYTRQKRWQEAETLFLQVVERRKRVLGPDHHDTLQSIHNLAYAYNCQERWQEAEPLLQQVVERRKRVLGPDHPDTLASMHNLTYAYNRQERWQEAEPLSQQVVERRKRVLGPDHPDTLDSMLGLAYSWKGLGHTNEATELMGQCAQARIRVLGREHPATQWSLSKLQDWRTEKPQSQERRRKPMARNREVSNIAEPRITRSTRRNRGRGSRPLSPARTGLRSQAGV